MIDFDSCAGFSLKSLERLTVRPRFHLFVHYLFEGIEPSPSGSPPVSDASWLLAPRWLIDT